MSNLHDKMLKDMQLRGFSPRTQYQYLKNLKSFETHFSKPAQQMGQDELRDFLHYLIGEKQVSSSYVNSVYSALKFFFTKTLGRTWDMSEIPRVKKARKLPLALSKDEIKRLLAVTTNIKFQSMFMLRHSFATHLLEEGVNLVYIQQLLGHARISTTTLYLHLAKVKILKVKSPLDSLDKN